MWGNLFPPFIRGAVMDDGKSYEDWCELYEYFKKDIMGYPESFKLQRFAVLRLRGLSEGKFMSNKKSKPMASYSYKTITLTMKLCKGKINDYIHRNKTKFVDEKHKINGIFIIIESEINDVVLRLNRAKKSEEKTKDLELKHQTNTGAKYKKKDRKENSNLENLW